MKMRTVQVLEPKKALGGLALLALLLLGPVAGQAQVPAQLSEKEMDTPYVPTPQVVVDRMLDLAGIRSGDMVIDLGSGDGRLVITAAEKYGARGFGVELDPRLVKLSNEEARKAGVADRVKFLQQDLFDTDFRQANVLTLYLLPDVNMAIRPKILSELRPGTRVVSHDYGMQEWRPDAEETIAAPDKTVGTRKESMVYMWVVPARVDGAWDLEIKTGKTARHLPLTLKQQFQRFSGSVSVGKQGSLALSEGRVRGEELRVALPGGVVDKQPAQLVGRVTGDSASGSVRRDDREIGQWTARRRGASGG